jgi:hypothetical protein
MGEAVGEVSYLVGEAVCLGDLVEIDGRKGQVVACMDADQYSIDFPRENWAYLKTGILWQSADIGLVHLPSLSDPDIVFIRRKHEDE